MALEKGLSTQSVDKSWHLAMLSHRPVDRRMLVVPVVLKIGLKAMHLPLNEAVTATLLAGGNVYRS